MRPGWSQPWHSAAEDANVRVLAIRGSKHAEQRGAALQMHVLRCCIMHTCARRTSEEQREHVLLSEQRTGLTSAQQAANCVHQRRGPPEVVKAVVAVRCAHGSDEGTERRAVHPAADEDADAARRELSAAARKEARGGRTYQKAAQSAPPALRCGRA